jgi:AraC-like DNA-binding protein
MRFIRSQQTWQIIDAFLDVRFCLEELAMRKGYRVAAVCEALGCSQRYLYVVFLRDIGLPPKHWMNLERMVVARRKLEGGKSIEHVSCDLGFRSVESFSRKFFEVYGIPPGRFQKTRILFDPAKPLPVGFRLVPTAQ